LRGTGAAINALRPTGGAADLLALDRALNQAGTVQTASRTAGALDSLSEAVPGTLAARPAPVWKDGEIIDNTPEAKVSPVEYEAKARAATSDDSKPSSALNEDMKLNDNNPVKTVPSVIQAKVDDFVDNALKPVRATVQPKPDIPIEYSEVSPQAAQLMGEDTNSDYSGFKNAVAAGDVRQMAKLGGASGDARYALTPEDIKKIPEITAAPDAILPIKGQNDFYLVRHDGGVTYRLRVEPQGDSLVAKELTREPAAPDVNVINGENPEFTFPEANGKIYEDAERTAQPKTPDRNYNEPDIGSERNIEGMGNKADILTQNRAQGRAYEQERFSEFSQNTMQAQEQITVKTPSSVRTRLDAIGFDVDGKIVIHEFISSALAPLTKNQKIAFPEIFDSGATVVGKGKGTFAGGYSIPVGTDVKIIRPPK
jgi:hypothetical protein